MVYGIMDSQCVGGQTFSRLIDCWWKNILPVEDGPG
jgi:hypothetical protein